MPNVLLGNSRGQLCTAPVVIKKSKKAKGLSDRALQITEERRKVKTEEQNGKDKRSPQENQSYKVNFSCKDGRNKRQKW